MKQVTVAVIGAGLRAGIYTGYAKHYPLDLKVVAVADPDTVRREQMMKEHGVPAANGFTDWKELLAGPALADAVLVCTQDRVHFEPTMRALEAGYHVMLEKPMSPSLEECIRMKEQADHYGRVLTICHVLRYTMFFQTIKELLDQGTIGDLMTIQHNENVAYWHQAHSFVRGNWRNSKESNPMILAKSCHDMDILLWLAGADCTSLSFYGYLSHFKEEHAPDGAPMRCLDGCPAAEECLYYAPKVYLTDEPTWMDMAIAHDYKSYEAKYEALRTGPYGRCVYHCDNDVVDHQVVSMEFANEVTAVFTMSAFTEECNRTLKLMGSKGEIRGHMEKNEIEVIPFGTGKRERITLRSQGGHIGHGGGDYGLMRDFIRVIRKNGQGEVLTSAAKSVESHMMAFAAERSRLEKRTVRLSEMSGKASRC